VGVAGSLGESGCGAAAWSLAALASANAAPAAATAVATKGLNFS
jgi:hypothetical protein